MRQFANYYLTPEEFGLWEYARTISHNNGIFYFDGRTVADDFAATGKTVIYRIAKLLESKGWFILLRKRKKNPRTGMFDASQYRVASLEEWLKAHPQQVRKESSLEIETGISSPETKTRLIQSQKRKEPVSKQKRTSLETDTYSVKDFSVKENPSIKPSIDGETDSPKSGTAADIASIRDAFVSDTGRDFKMFAAERAGLQALVRQHQLPTVRKWLGVWMEQGHDWDKVRNPCRAFLARIQDGTLAAMDSVQEKSSAAQQEQGEQVQKCILEGRAAWFAATAELRAAVEAEDTGPMPTGENGELMF